MNLTFEVPVKASHTLNSRSHWSVRARRRGTERNAVSLALPKHRVEPVLLITLTRVGPRAMDDDNVQGAMKGIRDEVAKQLRIDDGSPLIRWQYEQAKGEYAVHVRIESIGAARDEFEP